MRLDGGTDRANQTSSAAHVASVPPAPASAPPASVMSDLIALGMAAAGFSAGLKAYEQRLQTNGLHDAGKRFFDSLERNGGEAGEAVSAFRLTDKILEWARTESPLQQDRCHEATREIAAEEVRPLVECFEAGGAATKAALAERSRAWLADDEIARDLVPEARALLEGLANATPAQGVSAAQKRSAAALLTIKSGLEDVQRGRDVLGHMKALQAALEEIDSKARAGVQAEVVDRLFGSGQALRHIEPKTAGEVFQIAGALIDPVFVPDASSAAVGLARAYSQLVREEQFSTEARDVLRSLVSRIPAGQREKVRQKVQAAIFGADGERGWTPRFWTRTGEAFATFEAFAPRFESPKDQIDAILHRATFLQGIEGLKPLGSRPLREQHNLRNVIGQIHALPTSEQPVATEMLRSQGLLARL